jgi:hypothetical protein
VSAALDWFNFCRKKKTKLSSHSPAASLNISLYNIYRVKHWAMSSACCSKLFRLFAKKIK